MIPIEPIRPTGVDPTPPVRRSQRIEERPQEPREDSRRDRKRRRDGEEPEPGPTGDGHVDVLA